MKNLNRAELLYAALLLWITFVPVTQLSKSIEKPENIQYRFNLILWKKSILVSFGNHVLEEPVQILKNPVQEFYETRSNILKTEGQAFPVKEGSDTDEDLYG